jgi:hypothetical protein
VAVWGIALGAASGAVLGAAIDGVGAGVGAVVGAAVYAPAEVITTMSRSVGEIKPLWQHIFSSALLMALFGWLLALIYGPDELLLTAIISGALLGLLGLRPGKAALGLLIGASLGVGPCGVVVARSFAAVSVAAPNHRFAQRATGRIVAAGGRSKTGPAP